MPYKRYEPAPISEMLRKDYLGHHSICQYLRDIYNMVGDPTKVEEIQLKCREGIQMTKAMHKRLMHYKRLGVTQDIEQLEEYFEGNC